MDDVRMDEGLDTGLDAQAQAGAGAAEGLEGETQQQQQQQGGGGQVVASLYPPVPSVYARFTRQNIHRYRTLRDRLGADESLRLVWNEIEPSERIRRQQAVLEEADANQAATINKDEEREVDDAPLLPSLLPAPDWDLMLEMGVPNVDWIEEDGYYSCFGDRWPIVEQLPNLADTGVRQLYEAGVQDQRPTMQVLLRTLLKTYLTLIDQLLLPPKEYYFRNEVPAPNGGDGQEGGEGGTMVTQEGWRFATQDIAGEINDIVINFQHLLNELRPVQARDTLKSTMQEQVKRRRDEAALIRR